MVVEATQAPNKHVVFLASLNAGRREEALLELFCPVFGVFVAVHPKLSTQFFSHHRHGIAIPTMVIPTSHLKPWLFLIDWLLG